jgi:hypothetical protein
MTHAYLDNKSASDLMLDLFSHLATWPMRSPEAFRNVAIGNGLIAINPLLKVTKDSEVEFLTQTIENTVNEGKMITFGHIPNDVIRNESLRSRIMFESGEFKQPFENWIALSSWEGGFNGYHVSENPIYPGEILVLELYGISTPDRGDVILITHVEAPERLNRARAKQGKVPIPSHMVVHTRDYVATYHAAVADRVSRGGHHASPIAHWRRAHTRTLATGAVIPVRSSKVNWRDSEELHRLFYKVRL